MTLLILSGVVGCETPIQASKISPQLQNTQSEFNLIFRYGVGAKNELNTFNGTFTKDMVNKPSSTINMYLSEKELERIRQKMVEIDFFNYQDVFSISVPSGESTITVTPHSSYYFRVKLNSEVKELQWDDDIVNRNDDADKLRELIKIIRDIITSREEYKQLPEPASGFM
jgi:hypothetical protein